MVRDSQPLHTPQQASRLTCTADGLPQGGLSNQPAHSNTYITELSGNPAHALMARVGYGHPGHASLLHQAAGPNWTTSAAALRGSRQQQARCSVRGSAP
jgi:hypothetical protein